MNQYIVSVCMRSIQDTDSFWKTNIVNEHLYQCRVQAQDEELAKAIGAFEVREWLKKQYPLTTRIEITAVASACVADMTDPTKSQSQFQVL